MQEGRGSCNYWLQGMCALPLGLGSRRELIVTPISIHPVVFTCPCWGKLGCCQLQRKAALLKSLRNAASVQIDPKEHSSSTKEFPAKWGHVRCVQKHQQSWGLNGAKLETLACSPRIALPRVVLASGSVAPASVLLHQSENCRNKASHFACARGQSK